MRPSRPASSRSSRAGRAAGLSRRSTSRFSRRTPGPRQVREFLGSYFFARYLPVLKPLRSTRDTVPADSSLSRISRSSCPLNRTNLRRVKVPGRPAALPPGPMPSPDSRVAFVFPETDPANMQELFPAHSARSKERASVPVHPRCRSCVEQTSGDLLETVDPA